MKKNLEKENPGKKITKKNYQKEEFSEEPPQMNNENPVYLKLGYYESLEAKKDLLSSEMSFLNLMRAMKRYNALRLEEMELKSGMYKAIRELDSSLKKTKASFPFLKIPERAKREEIVKREAKEEIKPIREQTFDEDLESQLRAIQEKLNSIGR